RRVEERRTSVCLPRYEPDEELAAEYERCRREGTSRHWEADFAQLREALQEPVADCDDVALRRAHLGDDRGPRSLDVKRLEHLGHLGRGVCGLQERADHARALDDRLGLAAAADVDGD